MSLNFRQLLPFRRSLFGHALDVDAPLLTVDLRDLPLTVMVVPAHDHDLVVAPDGQRADRVNCCLLLCGRFFRYVVAT